MSYEYYNANPLNNNVSDCTIRAISVAEGKSWDETYKELSKLAQEQGILLDDVNFIESYLDKRYKRQCHYSRTINEFIEEHPTKTFLITMQRTYNCNKRWCAY